MQDGVYLKFFVAEKLRHEGILAYEWLLEAARQQGLPGGSAFRAIAGFGRHHQLHEDHFFELAGELPVEVGFALSAEQAEAFLARLAGEKLALFYTRMPVRMGVVGNGS